VRMKTEALNNKLGALRNYLYFSLRGWIPDSWKKTALNIGLAGVTFLGSIGLAYASCTPKPPVTSPIQPPAQTITINPVEEYAKSIGLSDEYVAILKPLGEDNKLDDSDKAAVDDAKKISNMTLSDSAKKVTISYLASGKVNEYDNAYSLLKSTSRQSGMRMHELGIDENVVNYISLVNSLPDKAFAKYAMENALCIQDRQLTELEKNFLQSPDEYSKQLYDYYLAGIDKINPELGKEMRKVPHYVTVDAKRVEAMEDVLGLASNVEYKSAFDDMLNIGIKDKRKYCSPLQGLEWLADDMDFDSEYSNPMKNFDLRIFMGQAWVRPSHHIDSWSFEEATDRVNAPELCALFDKSMIGYELYFDEKYSPREVFLWKKANCVDQARLNVYFLLENGDEKYTSDSKKANSCCVLTVMFDKVLPDGSKGHAVCLYTDKDGILHYISRTGEIQGPFNTEKDAATRVARDVGRNLRSYSLQ
jgi:hypothetical protein